MHRADEEKVERVKRQPPLVSMLVKNFYRTTVVVNYTVDISRAAEGLQRLNDAINDATRRTRMK